MKKDLKNRVCKECGLNPVYVLPSQVLSRCKECWKKRNREGYQRKVKNRMNKKKDAHSDALWKEIEARNQRIKEMQDLMFKRNDLYKKYINTF